ncbi:acetylornithine deacetylase/succinyl-diaminopimelate desuccinylase-like protein [Polymorphobacter multimanifer]|uniref:Acetylornithine deacetylase/succinyl-diaminopimelate desuccinylase-like protein n=1 Tax=Polymorphobacter multimanifer TaxID=1070431 RepID=A0A841L4V5_9SPHN|nr:M20/M25/M40 family metallo-hydrolase [Polymorphobacter multimanifer]MBB6227306.1 acetylornithine deacetylase/succinyl-diaminopimelate desuccinylase-like protein [Polymorphobacter multimanifer]
MRTSLLLFALLATPAAAQSPAALKLAHDNIANDYKQIVAEVVQLTEIPAPPFKEAARAARYAEMMKAVGLQEVTIDAVGNITSVRPGRDRKAKALVVSAHLDTVFPEGTPINVRREGTTLHAPGIGDDTIGLASMLAWVRAMDAAKIETRRDILFVATVGEEGQGDLRGVKHLFTENPLKARIGDFISFDGSGVNGITNGGVGSKRYSVTFKGPGGHSYGAYGIVNPMVAMASSVTGLYAITTPTDIKTTYAASTVTGGTSVNSIPNAITMEFDMRSRSPANLAALEKQLLGVIEGSVAAENSARNTRFGTISADPKLIGDRPAGETPASDPLVKAAQATLARNGYKSELGASSTDSNIPISLGIPAITLGAGAGGGRAHALDEFISIEEAPFVKGIQNGLDVVLAAVAVDRK